MNSKKYGRTYHFPFSPGTTNDDRIQYDYWNYVRQMKQVVLTEKLDGENNCLNRFGVFARSHAAPTASPWTTHLRQRWAAIKNDLGDMEFFGENLYAIHSIEYERIEQHYFVFALRCADQWLSWEEVSFYAAVFDFPTVPVLKTIEVLDSEIDFKSEVLGLAAFESSYGSIDPISRGPCTLEGVVSRNADRFPADDLEMNVFKYVRKGHVKTNEHWTRNWKRARLIYEQKNKAP